MMEAVFSLKIISLRLRTEIVTSLLHEKWCSPQGCHPTTEIIHLLIGGNMNCAFNRGEISCGFPQALIKKERCLTLLGVSGPIADLGLTGPWLGLVTVSGPGLVGLERGIKQRRYLEESSEKCHLLVCRTTTGIHKYFRHAKHGV